MREHSMRIESRTVKALAALVMAACLALLLLPASAQAYEGDTLAAGSVDVSTQAAKVKIEPITLWAGCDYYTSIWIQNLPAKAKIKKITSSKPKVIKAVRTGSGAYENYLMPLKPGKSKITVKYKVGSKTKTVSATYTVKKYPNPYASVSVNGKKVNIKKNKYFYDVLGYKKTSATVKLKAAKGWKIVDSYAFVENDMVDYTNGKSFKIPKGKFASVFYRLQNSKGESIQYGVRFSRNS